MSKYVVYSTTPYYDEQGRLCYDSINSGEYNDAESASMRAYELQCMGCSVQVREEKEVENEYDREERE